MSDPNATCDSRQVAIFLSQGMDDAEQAAFERHLESCLICRTVLEQEAGQSGNWAEAREMLTPDGAEPLTTSDDSVTSDFLDHSIGSVLSVLAPTDDPGMIGRLAGYEIVGVIGRGGMGVVLKGFDARLNRFVAIKSLAPQLAASGSARRRFAREARAAAAVVHENVVAIHGVAEFQGLPYLVMPYVKGESLQKRIDRTGPLGVMEILRIGRQMASGLAAAHAQGLVHRDIKPANILLEEGVERLQITDFGLARTVDDASETCTGIIAGTPQYMSPEQARGDAVDVRSDLFSLGSVLYQLCTGRPPFRAETPYGILRRITDTDPRPIREINPEIPDWLAAVVGKLHEKNPAHRLEAAETLADLLDQCLAHVQQPATVKLPGAVQELRDSRYDGPSWRQQSVAFFKSYRGRTLAALCGIAVVAAAVLLIRQSGLEVESKAVSEPDAPQSIRVPGWDAAAQDIEALSTEAEDLETRSLQLWDRQPVRPRDQAGLLESDESSAADDTMSTDDLPAEGSSPPSNPSESNP